MISDIGLDTSVESFWKVTSHMIIKIFDKYSLEATVRIYAGLCGCSVLQQLLFCSRFKSFREHEISTNTTPMWMFLLSMGRVLYSQQ